MHQNFSQRIEMQMPHENTYTEVTTMSSYDDNLDKLSKDYTLENYDKIKNFIKNNDEILDYIIEITPLLDNYFPNYQKVIEFCEDPEFSDLDFIMIYIKGSIFDGDYKILTKFKKNHYINQNFQKTLMDQFVWSCGRHGLF